MKNKDEQHKALVSVVEFYFVYKTFKQTNLTNYSLKYVSTKQQTNGRVLCYVTINIAKVPIPQTGFKGSASWGGLRVKTQYETLCPSQTTSEPVLCLRFGARPCPLPRAVDSGAGNATQGLELGHWTTRRAFISSYKFEHVCRIRIRHKLCVQRSLFVLWSCSSKLSFTCS